MTPNCERCGQTLPPGSSPYHLSATSSVWLCETCADPQGQDCVRCGHALPRGSKPPYLCQDCQGRAPTIEAASLADLGRFIASRTGNTEAAAIARSSAPQLRYDNVAYHLVADPQRRAEFTADELAALVARIGDDDKRAAAAARLNL
ncbi:MAG: hypothetical protein ACOYZ7_01170 [Chloroflexota bacterium]